MTDITPDEPENSKSKLPPRRADWHSGLKREDPENYRMTADDTVSDFIATPRGAESPDWDSIHGNIGHEGRETAFPASSRNGKVTLGYYQRHTRFTDWLIALLLSIAAFFAIVTTYHGFGHSWDEALYLKPAERAAAWMVGVINSGDDSLLKQAAVDRHWGKSLVGPNDPLHPEIAPIPKLLIGAGLTYIAPQKIDPMMATRLPTALLFALTVALLFLLGTREYGRIGGFSAAIFYALMPRVFGHAHIGASETALAFFVVLTVWCFLAANRFWVLALFTGIAFGLAVDTKISALMLPVPLMLWGQIYRRREYASNVFAMAFIAPVVVVALWPWLWYDGLHRFVSYVMYYVDHQPTAVYYLDQIWGNHQPRHPVAPFYYPLHIAALSLPIWILAFLAIGLLRALFSTVRRPVTVLFVLMAGAWLGLAMLPHAPRYDGERLFFPAFAFLALIAAGGFSAVFAGVRGWRDRRGHAGAGRETSYIGAVVLVLLTAYGAGDLFFTHPNELNYYNGIVGRSRGAYERGFETSYWGEAVNEDVTSYLTTILKPGDKVKTLALAEEAFENLRQWGKLPDKVDFSPAQPPYDYVIMQVRQGFMGPQERQLLRSKKPLRTFEVQGVPKIVVYAGPGVRDVFAAEESPADVATSSTSPMFDEGFDANVDEAATSATQHVEIPVETTSSIAAMDDRTTESEAAATAELTSGSLQTTAVVAVLDLPTSTSETTATADRMTTMPALELIKGADVPTSAPRIYEGDLPGTGTLPAAPGAGV